MPKTIRPIKPPKCRPIKPKPKPTNQQVNLMWFKKLSASISSLARAIDELAKRKTECECVKSHAALATKCDLEELGNKIMSQISDFLTKQEAFNTRQANAVDSLVTSVEGLTGDIAEQTRLIKELQDSAGEVTPEDATRIDAIQANNETISTKLEAVSTALAALDSQNPPKVPPSA